MSGRDLEGAAAQFAREMAVYGTGQVVDRGVLIEVCVHHDLQRLELLEDAIHRRRADVGLTFLYRVGYLVGGQVTVRRDENLGDRSFSHGGPAIGPADRRDDLVDFGVMFNHGKTLCPLARSRTARRVTNCVLP